MPRAIRVTWPAFKARLVDVLRARGVDVEVAIFNIDVQHAKVDGVFVNASDSDRIVPHAHYESHRQRDIDTYLRGWSPQTRVFRMPYAPGWHRAVYNNGMRQLFIEDRVAKFLKRNHQRFDAAIAAVPDNLVLFDVRLADVARAIEMNDAMFIPNFRDHGGYTNGYYIGAPQVLARVMRRLHEMDSYSETVLNGTDHDLGYEGFLTCALRAHRVRRLVTAQQFFRVRASRHVGWGHSAPGGHVIDWRGTDRDVRGGRGSAGRLYAWMAAQVEKLRCSLEYVQLIWSLREQWPLIKYVDNGDLVRTLQGR